MMILEEHRKKELAPLVEIFRNGGGVVFSGAGMSTASGLPDFRSSRGLWKQADPARLASVEALRGSYETCIDFYRERIRGCFHAAPNEGHRILGEWERLGLLRGIITQNVDGFHDLGGSSEIAELHGSLRRCRCMECEREFPGERLLEDFLCPSCGGRLRPGVVLFGESLPPEAMEKAETLAHEASFFLVLGSSLLVSPANWYPQMAKESGAWLGIVNRETTPLDALADGVFSEDILTFLQDLHALLLEK